MSRRRRTLIVVAVCSTAAFIVWRRWRGPWPITPQPSWPAAAWAEPVDGNCPPGYPVKVSAGGVIHVPNGRSYGRTRPVRCYRTPESAERDGYRRAQG
jgi:hypothetical protein